MADAAKLELSRQLQSILTALMDSRSVSAPFLEPVDWEGGFVRGGVAALSSPPPLLLPLASAPRAHPLPLRLLGR